MRNRTLSYAFRASLPVMAAYVVIGIGFGIVMYGHGYAWYWATLMSLVIFAGSMQFVAVDLLAAGAGLLTFAVTTLFVNARHLFYGLTMLNEYGTLGKAKPYAVFALTDETFSLVCGTEPPEDIDRAAYYLLVSLLDHAYWVVGSTLGAVLGTALSFNSTGIEFSMTALFTVSMLDQWEKSSEHLPALIGFGVSVICLLLFGPERFLLPAMLAITLLLLCVSCRGKEGAPHA